MHPENNPGAFKNFTLLFNLSDDHLTVNGMNRKLTLGTKLKRP
jgi:hypothetical protein